MLKVLIYIEEILLVIFGCSFEIDLKDRVVLYMRIMLG